MLFTFMTPFAMYIPAASYNDSSLVILGVVGVAIVCVIVISAYLMYVLTPTASLT